MAYNKKRNKERTLKDLKKRLATAEKENDQFYRKRIKHRIEMLTK